MPTRARNAVALLATIAAAGAATAVGAQTDGPTLAQPETAFRFELAGAAEVPGPGDPDATGTARMTINTATGQVCVNLTTTGLEPMTGLHIHEAAAGAAGPVRVDFAVTSGTGAARCVSTSTAQAEAIVAAPAGFYLNAHTATYADGAIRGQLAAAGDELGGLRLLAAPVRAYDSRSGERLPDNGTRTVDLTRGANGQASGLPVGARSALVTLTVTQTVDGGYLTLYSNALTQNPGTSTINWTESGQDVAATTTVAVDGAGRVKVSAGPRGTHFIVDVIGYSF